MHKENYRRVNRLNDGNEYLEKQSPAERSRTGRAGRNDPKAQNCTNFPSIYSLGYIFFINLPKKEKRL